LNPLGYQRLAADKVDEAIVMFELAVRHHPDSWNAWDSLGEGYMRRGDTPSAIKHSEHSLQLNPANNNAVEILTKLKAK
jgi:cytochrome c-type biogenesis protein CcmH/NrfG